MPFCLLAALPATPAEDRYSAWLKLLVEAPLSSLVITSLLILLFLLCFLTMFLKASLLRKAHAANQNLLSAYRNAPHPLAMLQFGERHPLSPLDGIYQAGGREMSMHLTGSRDVTHDFLMRLRLAAKITPTQLRSVDAAMRNAILEGQIALEKSMGGLSAVLCTLPWLGCLAPLLAYLEIQGQPILTQTQQAMAAFAPVALALLGSVACQLRLRLLTVKLRRQFLAMELFANELQNDFDHTFVDHSRALEKLPSIEAFTMDGPSFNLPPTEALARPVSTK